MKPSGNVLRVMNGNSRTSKPSRNFDGYFEEDNIKAAEDAGTEKNQKNMSNLPLKKKKKKKDWIPLHTFR